MLSSRILFKHQFTLGLVFCVIVVHCAVPLSAHLMLGEGLPWMTLGILRRCHAIAVSEPRARSPSPVLGTKPWIHKLLRNEGIKKKSAWTAVLSFEKKLTYLILIILHFAMIKSTYNFLKPRKQNVCKICILKISSCSPPYPRSLNEYPSILQKCTFTWILFL